jgi:hypothetical protein
MSGTLDWWHPEDLLRRDLWSSNPAVFWQNFRGETERRVRGGFIGSGGFKSGRNLRELKRGRNYRSGLVFGVNSGPRLKTTSC